MGTTKNLADTEAIEKIKELAEDINICMFCTHLDQQPFQTRPMGTQKVDEDGTFWFLSAEESDKNQEIKQDDKVQLIYSKPSDTHFMTVYGTASVSKDKKKIEELWNPFAKAWFKEGKDDPRLTVISVKPESAYYWDTKFGKMVTLLAIAYSTVTSKEIDAGVEGSLKV